MNIPTHIVAKPIQTAVVAVSGSRFSDKEFMTHDALRCDARFVSRFCVNATALQSTIGIRVHHASRIDQDFVTRRRIRHGAVFILMDSTQRRVECVGFYWPWQSHCCPRLPSRMAMAAAAVMLAEAATLAEASVMPAAVGPVMSAPL